MAQQAGKQGRRFFYVILVVLAILALYFLSPFISVILIAAIAAILLKPLYEWFLLRRRVRGRPGWAITLTLLTTFLIIFIPIFLIGYNFISQLGSVTDEAASDETQTALEETVAEIEEYLQGAEIDQEQVAEALLGLANEFLSWLGGLLASLGVSLLYLIMGGIVFIIVFAGIMPNYEAIGDRIQQLSPLDKKITQIYQVKTREMVFSVVKGVFLIAILQGAIMGIFYVIAGVPYALFWTLLSMAFAMLPVVGISYLVLFMSAIFIINGNPTSAIILLFGFYVVVNPLDFILRPRLLSKEAYLNFTLMLLALFGGMAVGGLLGMILGPVVMLLFITSLDIYREHFASPADQEVAILESGDPDPTTP